MNRKQQGDLGVAAAIFHYTKKGYVVCAPLTDNARYDLLVDKGVEGIRRIQVKSTSQVMDSGSYRVELSTQGGNQSWTGKITYLSRRDCDEVFVYCLNGDMYEFRVEDVEDKRRLTLGKAQTKFKVGA